MGGEDGVWSGGGMGGGRRRIVPVSEGCGTWVGSARACRLRGTRRGKRVGAEDRVPRIDGKSWCDRHGLPVHVPEESERVEHAPRKQAAEESACGGATEE